jgi:hypothetical protein
VGSDASAELSLNASERGLVLTVHQGGVLPLTAGKKLAVLGPHALSQEALIQPYPFLPACSLIPLNVSCAPGSLCRNGLPCPPSGACPANNGSDPYSCIPSLVQALDAYNQGGTTVTSPGCDLFDEGSPGSMAAAVAAATAADVVVLALGITTYSLYPGPKTRQEVITSHYCSFNALPFWANQSCADGFLELEAHDRLAIGIPPVQHELARQVLALNKPTVIVLIHGGAIAYVQEKSHTGPLAIVDAFYPGSQGAAAIARSLFGISNRWGRMPYTVYPDAWVNQTLMKQHDLTQDGGRTYRFYNGTAVATFGSGLTLTSFDLTLASSAQLVLDTSNPSGTATVTLQVQNSGSRLGDCVVTAMHQPRSVVPSAGAPWRPPPIRQALWDFARVEDVAVGNSVPVSFPVTLASVGMADMASGNITAMPGSYTLVFSDGSGRSAGTVSVQLEVTGAALVLDPFPSKEASDRSQ